MLHQLPPCLSKAAQVLALAASLGVLAPTTLFACYYGYYDPAVDRWVATGPCRDDFFKPFVCADGRNVSLLYFAQGEAHLAPDLLDEIDDLVANRDLWDQRLPGMAPFDFQLLAYSDPTEVPDRADLSLSQNRGESVRDALMAAGVPAGSIIVVNFGPKEYCPSDTPDGRAGNRKVEVYITPGN